MRHDVDYDPTWAATLARCNQELGVSATFFFLLCSPNYNLLTKSNRAALETVLESGQDVGLHYFWQGQDEDKSQLETQMDILKTICPLAQRMVAWHNPSGDLQHANQMAAQLDMVSAYDPAFCGQNRYISDSNTRHTGIQISQFITENLNPLIQVLLHPLIWVIGGKDMSEILQRAFSQKVAQLNLGFSENHLWKQSLSEKIYGPFKRQLHD